VLELIEMKILNITSTDILQSAITDVFYCTRKDIHVDSIESPLHAIALLESCLAKETMYDMVVTDLQCDNRKLSFDLIEFCFHHRIPIIVLSFIESKTSVNLALKFGASSYISLFETIETIRFGLIEALSKNNYISPRIDLILSKSTDNWEPHPLLLTSSEKKLLYYLSKGMTMKEISDTYNIKDNTLRKQRRNMLVKNNCSYEKLLACFHEFPFVVNDIVEG